MENASEHYYRIFETDIRLELAEKHMIAEMPLWY